MCTNGISISCRTNQQSQANAKNWAVLNQHQTASTLKGHVQFSPVLFQLPMLSQSNTQHLEARYPKTETSFAEVINCACASKHTNKSTIDTMLFSGPAQIPHIQPRPLDRCEAELLEFGGESVPAAAWRRAPGACWPASSAPPSSPIDHGGLDWGKQQWCEPRNNPGTKRQG